MKKIRNVIVLPLATILALSLCACEDGTMNTSANINGTREQIEAGKPGKNSNTKDGNMPGETPNGVPPEGGPPNGAPPEGGPPNGAPPEGGPPNGGATEGQAFEGTHSEKANGHGDPGRRPPKKPDGSRGIGGRPPKKADGTTSSNGTASKKADGTTSSNGTASKKADGTTSSNAPTSKKTDGNGNSNSTPPNGAPPEGAPPNGAPPDGPPPNGAPPDGPPPNGAPPDGPPPNGVPPKKPDGSGGPGGGSANIKYSGTTELVSADTQKGKTYTSTTADKSALLIATSDKVTLTNPTVVKSGSSNGGDNCNFYGLNAAVLVKDGSTTTITGGKINTDANGANGVFSYGGNGGNNGAKGDGTTAIIRNTKIVTKGNSSGGIMTTGGGKTYAYNLDVTTSGQSSAAIRTDRGGGTVVVDGGRYTSNGLGSPAIYSTADITVSNATLNSNLSEGVCIEGLNSVTLNNCNLTAKNTKRNSNATFLDTIMLYQSMSGDAAGGTSRFTMTGGSITSKSGHVFHVTNTNAIITLKGVAIDNKDAQNILLSVCADGWKGGSNIATLKAVSQKLNGAIKVGSDSRLTLELASGSTFKGSIDGKITNAKGETVSKETGTVSVTLDKNSTWTLTGDSYVTEFNGDTNNVISNGFTLYVNGVALKTTK